MTRIIIDFANDTSLKDAHDLFAELAKVIEPKRYLVRDYYVELEQTAKVV